MQDLEAGRSALISGAEQVAQHSERWAAHWSAMCAEHGDPQSWDEDCVLRRSIDLRIAMNSDPGLYKRFSALYSTVPDRPWSPLPEGVANQAYFAISTEKAALSVYEDQQRYRWQWPTGGPPAAEHELEIAAEHGLGLFGQPPQVMIVDEDE